MGMVSYLITTPNMGGPKRLIGKRALFWAINQVHGGGGGGGGG